MTVPHLTVVHADTQDNLNGQPWPPDGNDLWSVVDRTNGVTAKIVRVVLAASDARLHGGTTRQSKST